MFKKATRSQVKLKLANTGPSGSGKTLSALLLAKGLGGKIAVIDTENGSASLYADKIDFDTMTITPPYTTEKYIEAINGAVKAGYGVLVIDSITHAWSGEGGLLSQKEQLDSRGGNSYTNWAKITPKHEAFLGAILHSDIHLIATMRSKQDYVLADKNGKQVPQKVGMAPQQRDGAEYEFTTVFDIAMNHEAVASKDRTGLFDGKIFKIGAETGEMFLKWLDGAAAAKPATEEQLKTMLRQPAKPKAVPVGNIATTATMADISTKPAVTLESKPSMENPGEYVVPFGKYKGSSLSKLTPDDVENYVQYLIKKADEDKKELRGQVLEFIEHAEAYVASKQTDWAAKAREEFS